MTDLYTQNENQYTGLKEAARKKLRTLTFLLFVWSLSLLAVILWASIFHA